jgi:hypothetical protein
LFLFEIFCLATAAIFEELFFTAETQRAAEVAQRDFILCDSSAFFAPLR